MTPMRLRGTITFDGLRYIGASAGNITGVTALAADDGKNITVNAFNVSYSTNSSMFSGSSLYITPGQTNGFFSISSELGA